MQPTTVTTIVLIVFGVAILAVSLYNLFGDWQPQVRRVSHQESVEAEYELAVRELRKAIREYERGPRNSS
jgi:hypothetical protein